VYIFISLYVTNEEISHPIFLVLSFRNASDRHQDGSRHRDEELSSAADLQLYALWVLWPCGRTRRLYLVQSYLLPAPVASLLSLRSGRLYATGTSHCTYARERHLVQHGPIGRRLGHNNGCLLPTSDPYQLTATPKQRFSPTRSTVSFRTRLIEMTLIPPTNSLNKTDNKPVSIKRKGTIAAYSPLAHRSLWEETQITYGMSLTTAHEMAHALCHGAKHGRSHKHVLESQFLAVTVPKNCLRPVDPSSVFRPRSSSSDRRF
jgi:hypothetical protein